MAQRGHAHPLPGLHERDREASAVPRLPGSRRSLDEEVAPIERECGLGKCPVEARPRRLPLQDRAGGRISIPVLGEAQKRCALHIRVERSRRDQTGRKRLLRPPDATGERERAVLVVDLHVVGLAGLRIDRLARDPVLLRRERERVLEASARREPARPSSSRPPIVFLFSISSSSSRLRWKKYSHHCGFSSRWW